MKFLRDNLNYILPSALFFGVTSFIFLRKYFKSSPFLDITKNTTQDHLKFLYFRFVFQLQIYQEVKQNYQLKQGTQIWPKRKPWYERIQAEVFYKITELTNRTIIYRPDDCQKCSFCDWLDIQKISQYPNNFLRIMSTLSKICFEIS